MNFIDSAGRRRRETEHAWLVSIDQIKGNGYNLDIKNPNVSDDSYGDPTILASEQRYVDDSLQTAVEHEVVEFPPRPGIGDYVAPDVGDLTVIPRHYG